jgi:hypothetical protein
MSHAPGFESAEYYVAAAWAGLPKSFVLVRWSGLADKKKDRKEGAMRGKCQLQHNERGRNLKGHIPSCNGCQPLRSG